MVTRLLLRFPWFVTAPAIALTATVLAAGLYVLGGKYFERTFLDEPDPLAGTELSSAPPAGGTRSNLAPMSVQSSVPTSTPSIQPVAGTPPAVAPSSPALLSEGVFVDGDPGHRGRGTARLIRGADGGHVLRFEDFSVTNGPDLFVVLSTDPGGSRASASADDALYLGRLRATDGNVNYAVPEDADPSIYRSVIIYCRAFRVVFAVATLEAR